MCRREGVSICGREKCAVKKRPFPPGSHGPTAHGRPTGYGIQLREKQKAKRIYGLTERQFERYFNLASRKKGDTGEFLVAILEQRLDNVVYRLGLAKTRSQARQLVTHGHIKVNGKKVDIPSFAVKAGDQIAVREKSATGALFKNAAESLAKHDLPGWLKLTPESLQGTVLSLPEGNDLKQPFEPKLIVEFYSR
jgi:small subunit ribosomal protein S4